MTGTWISIGGGNMELKIETYNRLSRIQKELKAPKGQFNPFGKFNYRSCEDILTAVKTILMEGETVTISDKIVSVGDRYYVDATATFAYQGYEINVTASAREQQAKKGMDEAQITGSTSSYARKYALNGLFAIDDTKDPDSGDPKQLEKEKQDEADKKFEQYELELEAAFNEGVGAKWWADNYQQAKKDCPKDFQQLVQLKDALKLKASKVTPGSDNAFKGQNDLPI